MYTNRRNTLKHLKQTAMPRLREEVWGFLHSALKGSMATNLLIWGFQPPKMLLTNLCSLSILRFLCGSHSKTYTLFNYAQELKIYSGTFTHGTIYAIFLVQLPIKIRRSKRIGRKWVILIITKAGLRVLKVNFYVPELPWFRRSKRNV